jgi:hypothetical protein
MNRFRLGHDLSWRDLQWHDLSWRDLPWRDLQWHATCLLGIYE